MELDPGSWNTMRQYVKSGDRVAELYHGNRDDLLRGLSRLTGEGGIVYGIDAMNPAHDCPPQMCPNIRLLRSHIPPMPTEAVALDSITIREFLWTFDRARAPRLEARPETYSSFDKSLRYGGHLILVLNPIEQAQERGGRPVYQEPIRRYLPGWTMAHDDGPLMIFRKLDD